MTRQFQCPLFAFIIALSFSGRETTALAHCLAGQQK